MPFWFGWTIVFAVLAAAAACFWVVAYRVFRARKAEYEPRRGDYGSNGAKEAMDEADGFRLGAKVTTLIFLGIAGLGLVFSVPCIVAANNVGIVTEFGRPVGAPLANGGHFVAPWAKVDRFSTQNQASVRSQSAHEGDKAVPDCVQVKLNGGATACIDVTVRYAIDSVKAVDLWKKYGSFDTVRDQLVRSVTNDSLRYVYSAYSAEQASFEQSTLRSAVDHVKDDLGQRLGQYGVKLDSVSIGELHLDQTNQDRMNALQQAQTDVKIAQQQKAKAEALAEANRALAGSLTPEIIAQHCLDTSKEMKGLQLMTCPGVGGSTAGTPPVILNPSGK